MSTQEITQILVAIEGLRHEVEGLKASKADPVECALHTEAIKRLLESQVEVEERLEAVEDQQGQKNAVRLGLGAIGAGMVFALQWLIPAVMDIFRG